ncbi:MAG TPA: hypothetical protein VGL38_09410 [bacterium]|jgi:hypothetical protein
MRLLSILLCITVLSSSDVLARGGHHYSSRSYTHHSAHAVHHRDSAYHTERSVTTAEKREAFRRAGVPWSQRHNYVVDHIVALENGGTNDISNLQIQTKEAAKAKDKLENAEAAARRHAQHPQRHHARHGRTH